TLPFYIRLRILWNGLFLSLLFHYLQPLHHRLFFRLPVHRQGQRPTEDKQKPQTEYQKQRRILENKVCKPLFYENPFRPQKKTSNSHHAQGNKERSEDSFQKEHFPKLSSGKAQAFQYCQLSSAHSQTGHGHIEIIINSHHEKKGAQSSHDNPAVSDIVSRCRQFIGFCMIG